MIHFESYISTDRMHIIAFPVMLIPKIHLEIFNVALKLSLLG